MVWQGGPRISTIIVSLKTIMHCHAQHLSGWRGNVHSRLEQTRTVFLRVDGIDAGKYCFAVLLSMFRLYYCLVN